MKNLDTMRPRYRGTVTEKKDAYEFTFDPPLTPDIVERLSQKTKTFIARKLVPKGGGFALSRVLTMGGGMNDVNVLVVPKSLHNDDAEQLLEILDAERIDIFLRDLKFDRTPRKKYVNAIEDLDATISKNRYKIKNVIPSDEDDSL